MPGQPVRSRLGGDVGISSYH